MKKNMFMTGIICGMMAVAVLGGCAKSQSSGPSSEQSQPSGSTETAAKTEAAGAKTEAAGAKTEAAKDTAAPAGANEAESLTLAKIKEKGVLTMVTDAAWAPFEYMAEGEDPVGSDIDLAKAVADGLGVKLKIINASFDSISTYLDSGEADLAAAAITITDERKDAMDFTIPYTVSTQYIIVPESDTATKAIENLAGKKIGVHLGTTGDFLVSDEVLTGSLADSGAEAVQYKNLAEGCLAMKNGELQAIVCDDLLAKNLCEVNQGLMCFEAKYADGTGTKEEYGIAVKKGDPGFVEAINAIIEPLIKDGTVNGFIEHHKELAAVSES